MGCNNEFVKTRIVTFYDNDLSSLIHRPSPVRQVSLKTTTLRDRLSLTARIVKRLVLRRFARPIGTGQSLVRKDDIS